MQVIKPRRDERSTSDMMMKKAGSGRDGQRENEKGRERDSEWKNELNVNHSPFYNEFLVCAAVFVLYPSANEFVYRMDFSRCHYNYYYWGCCFWVNYDAKMKRAICKFNSVIAIEPFLVGLKEWACCFLKAIVVCEHWTITYVHIERYLTNRTTNTHSPNSTK